MSLILRCDCPGCTETTIVATAPQANSVDPADGWTVSNNASGYVVHAHNDAHLALARATTGDPAAIAVA